MHERNKKCINMSTFMWKTLRITTNYTLSGLLHVSYVLKDSNTKRGQRANTEFMALSYKAYSRALGQVAAAQGKEYKVGPLL